MSGDGGRHAVRRILTAPGPQNPGDSESGEAAYYMNRARSPRIDEPVTEPVIGAELREPAASPHPMRKKRVGPASQDRSRSATRPKPPAIRAAPQRDQRSQPHAENLQQRGQRCGRAIKRHSAGKKWLRSNPIPTFSRPSEDVTRPPDEPLPGKSTNEIHDSRDRQAGYRRHHHVTRAARAPQTGIDERNSRSEEHTSELQSQFHLVCRLLLEKKKKIKNQTYIAQKNHNEHRSK